MRNFSYLDARKSIRKYEDKPVTRELLTLVCEGASLAPSWKNSQTVRYIAVVDEAVKKQLAEASPTAQNARIISECGALIVETTVTGICGYNSDGSFTTKKGDRWESYDAGIAGQTFCLAAAEMGLGTVILGLFDEDKVAQIVQVPDGQTVAALIAVGWPAEEPPRRPRLKAEELISFR